MQIREYPRWFWLFAALILFASSIPYLFGLLSTPDGQLYLGAQTNLDDHAVYAAWAKQAQEGRFLFENRFTTEDQPRLTINIYFLLVGNIAKLVGVPAAMHLCRLVFGLLLLMALFRFAARLSNETRKQIFALVIATAGAGIGFLLWSRYGHTGPIDVWQPEAFGFPSLMTNGLFCASLCLMLVVWENILVAKDSWKPVLPGAFATLILANIHTYDVLTIALTAVCFVAICVRSQLFTGIWFARACVIGAGALPSIAWFVYVRANDPVFAARAETVTHSAAPHLVLYGFSLLLVLALTGSAQFQTQPKWSVAAPLLFAIGSIFILQNNPPAAIFFLVFAILVGLSMLIKTSSTTAAFLLAWMVVGLVIIYYPGLFQRKLIAGYFIPLGLFAGLAVATFDKQSKLLPSLTALILSITSIRWIQREIEMAKDNLSNTAMHSIYLSADAKAILAHLRKNASPNDGIAAIPGVSQEVARDQFTLVVTDLNPVLAGWGGVKAYAGHWSETPNYTDKRVRLWRDLYSPTATRESAEKLINEAKLDWVVWPHLSVDLQSQIRAADAILPASSELVYDGAEFSLYKIR